MNWKRTIPLESAELIDEFERVAGYSFCESFKKLVIDNNRGRPSKYVFDTKKTKERVFNHLLSFNKEDEVNMWIWLNVWDEPAKHLAERYIVFACDPFGNDICFDKTNDKVVFIDHETLTVEEVADSFDEFINSLYEDED